MSIKNNNMAAELEALRNTKIEIPFAEYRRLMNRSVFLQSYIRHLDAGNHTAANGLLNVLRRDFEDERKESASRE